jgi:hypothetical protein
MEFQCKIIGIIKSWTTVRNLGTSRRDLILMFTHKNIYERKRIFVIKEESNRGVV